MKKIVTTLLATCILLTGTAFAGTELIFVTQENGYYFEDFDEIANFDNFANEGNTKEDIDSFRFYLNGSELAPNERVYIIYKVYDIVQIQSLYSNQKVWTYEKFLKLLN